MKGKQEVGKTAPNTIALTVDDVDEWAAARSLEEAQSIRQRMYDVVWGGRLQPVEENLDELWRRIPELSECLDARVIRARLDECELLDGVVELYPGFRVVPLTVLVPELKELHASCVSAVAAADVSSIERAESWLRQISVDAREGDDLEAAIYFASRSSASVPSRTELADAWHQLVKAEVLWTKPGNHEELLARAHPGASWHREVAAALRLYGLRLFRAGHLDVATSEATLLRAVQWFEVEGFEPWVNEVVDALSSGPDADVDAFAAWSLFYYLRADLALSRPRRHGLETWFWRLARASSKEDPPWRQLNPDRSPIWVDYIPIAAILVFAWHRIHPADSHYSALLDRALAFVQETQLPDGGWPLHAHQSNSDFLSTAACLHTLFLAKPAGWRDAAERGAAWLESQQDPLGFWSTHGGPTVTLTVLALDAICLGRGQEKATFTAPDSTAGADEAVEPEAPDYDPIDQPWHNPRRPHIIARARNSVADTADLLIVVATDVELRQVLAEIRPPYRIRSMPQVNVEAETFFLGRFGAHSTAVLRCSMGSTGPTAAQLAVASGIRVWRPKAVIMPGLAFGMARTKQRPADLLIAQAVVPYESQRRGQEVESRSQPYNASPLLLSRLRNREDWAFRRPDNTAVTCHEGLVLSGEKLIDEPSFKAELAMRHPKCIGGEMEGAGLAAACAREVVPWVLVKGVCDWADGRKNDRYQEMAAAAAVSLCKHVFADDEYALAGLHRPAKS